jgi:hypothetical protein
MIRWLSSVSNKLGYGKYSYKNKGGAEKLFSAYRYFCRATCQLQKQVRFSVVICLAHSFTAPMAMPLTMKRENKA